MTIELRGLPIVFLEEGDIIIAHCVPLDVSSCGHDIKEARRNAQEAIELFLETCETIGSLNEVLEESGFVWDGENWIPPTVLQVDCLDIAPQAM